ncbi:hypothetical protein PGTUg99_025353 [Puccinia graminis f. sp. tritici]|uniref:Uncharacterized protein n=1 Tax=Puccinia graminis f. sp. tritici TaxID=56615 RepID=A0A5B0RD56_PUCGR|nr:hypothetical protein PGTUg99_025353 [Puccinia graminis f. sp. tritici]
MNIMWINMAIQLLTFQLTANIQSVDGSFMRKSTVKGNTGLHQIIQECDHSPKEGKISCGCYSNKILTRGFKELSATKAINSSLKDGEISNKGKIRSEPWKAVYACYSKTIKDFTAWRSDYTKLKLDEETNQEVEVHLKEVINSVENLFEKKLHQLENQSYHSIQGLNTHVSERMFETADQDWLSYIADFLKIERITGISKGDDQERNEEIESAIMRWRELTMDFFIDSQELNIVSEQSLIHFLNKKTKGKLISDYIIHCFDPKGYKFRLYNFDLILSLKESPLVQRMSGLFKILQQEAWENIELNVLKVQIDSVLEIPVIFPEDYSEEMKKTMKDVLQIISPKKGELPDIGYFLDKVLLPYIASDSKSVHEEQEVHIILNSKLLYDFLRFFIRYHSKDLPASFIRDILNGSERFRKIRLFEEDIGLYYSMSHSKYVRYQVILNHLSPASDGRLRHELKHQVNSLIDSNENRKISNFEITEDNHSHNYPNFPDVDQYKLDRILTDRLSGLLHDGSSIDVSDRKLEQQIKRYLHQNQVLGGQPINIKQNILYRLLHVEEYYCTTIKQFRKLFHLKQNNI